MEPEQVAPMVGYLCHEDCVASGEMYVAMGGRVARAWIAENASVYQPAWSLEEIAERIDLVWTDGDSLAFTPVPDGQLDHLLYGLKMIGNAAN